LGTQILLVEDDEAIHVAAARPTFPFYTISFRARSTAEAASAA
jgi:hypothetical protein